MDFQTRIEGFCREYRLQNNIETAVLDLVSEIGEVAKEVLKATKYGKQEAQLTKDFEMEMGDLFFSLIVLANQTGIDLNNVLNMVLEKYRARFAEKGTVGSE